MSDGIRDLIKESRESSSIYLKDKMPKDPRQAIERKPCINCGKLIYYRISKKDNKGFRHMINSCDNCLQETRIAVEEFMEKHFYEISATEEETRETSS